MTLGDLLFILDETASDLRALRRRVAEGPLTDAAVAWLASQAISVRECVQNLDELAERRAEDRA